jgi:hypothetical protein
MTRTGCLGVRGLFALTETFPVVRWHSHHVVAITVIMTAMLARKQPISVCAAKGCLNELSLIRTRMIRSGKTTQRFTTARVKPYRAPREHYAS